MDLITNADKETATLAWLLSALQHARKEGQSTLVGYLEAVLDDAVFEREAAARSRPRHY